ncbi:MAG: hypothetical protein GX144_05845 [Clostridiaceae bacterium]|nr:hypothetical protein [Clostridiaceae bacterium]
MTVEEATAELALLQKKMHAFNHATGMIYLDRPITETRTAFTRTGQAPRMISGTAALQPRFRLYSLRCIMLKFSCITQYLCRRKRLPSFMDT